MRKVAYLFALACLGCFLFSGASKAAEPSSGIAGFWKTRDGDAIIEMYPCGDQFCGRFQWLKDDSPDNPSLDDNNPDPDKRKRPLCGLTFMGGFIKTNEKDYEKGWIYSPRHGSMFSANLRILDPDTLEIHGYMLLPLLGESQIWRRAEAPVPSCGAESEQIPKP
jgi:uncharacterized protein (DUF2147 family)